MNTIEFENTFLKYERIASGCYKCLSHSPSKHHGYCFYSRHNGPKIKIVHILADLLNIEKPEGKTTMKCKNKWCVNPRHLIAYRVRGEEDKDLSPLYRKKGEENNKAKLTEQQVIEIRKSKKMSTVLAEEYNVTPSQIRKIKQNESWKHISKRISKKPKPRREKKNPHKSVYRFDYLGKHGSSNKGWKVRFVWKGQNYQKDFSDSTNGGKQKALKKAIQWRDEKHKEIGKPNINGYIVLNPQPSNTGYVGIRKTYYRYRKNGYWYGYNCFEARWKHKGKSHVSRINIDKYGEEEALNRAIARRQLAEISMYGTTLQDMVS